MKQKNMPFANRVDTITQKELVEMVFTLWGRNDRMLKFLKRNVHRLNDLETSLKKLRLNLVENNVEVLDMVGNIDFLTRGLTSLEGDFFAYIGEPDEGDKDNIHPISEESTQEKLTNLSETIKKEENKAEEIGIHTCTPTPNATENTIYDGYLDGYNCGGYGGKFGCQSPIKSSETINNIKKVCTIQIDKQNKIVKKERVLKK